MLVKPTSASRNKVTVRLLHEKGLSFALLAILFNFCWKFSIKDERCDSNVYSDSGQLSAGNFNTPEEYGTRKHLGKKVLLDKGKENEATNK